MVTYELSPVCRTIRVFFVERFGVWQNVHVLDTNSVGNSTSVARLHVHIQSWYDEVEVFDIAEVGFVNFTARANLSYIAFASATISQVGCGRAIYTARQDEPTNQGEFAMAVHTIPVGIGDRVETLVCNYGPLDRKTQRELYQDGVPALCPQGTVRSLRYGALCRKCFPPSRVPLCVQLRAIVVASSPRSLPLPRLRGAVNSDEFSATSDERTVLAAISNCSSRETTDPVIATPPRKIDFFLFFSFLFFFFSRGTYRHEDH
ncbi:uncharacterized protein LOC143153643 [Ptiloglossa arizonensis]|uniref:uncharacterized protein LOC143153643 n=1 Tax=Ptiloglossa arizonensis TaxID=3350558 RepID=UPI003FA0A42D